MKDVYALIIAVMVSGAVAFTGLPQQKDKDNRKDQTTQNDKNISRDKKNKKQPAGQAKKEKNDSEQLNNKKRIKESHPGFSDQVREKIKNNKGAQPVETPGGWQWDNESFKERKKFLSGKKVTVCHKFRGNEVPVSLQVSVNALQAHLDHGDVEGACPAINDERFSDVYINERNAYYNQIQRSREQISYSRSILDYALQRLTDTRSQLTVMRNTGAAPAAIERKEAVVIQLEEEVSLLETLIGVTAGLLADKLK